MKKKTKRRHSLRTKLMMINLSVTVSSLILCALLFILSVWLIIGRYINQDQDFFLTEVGNNLNTRFEYMGSVVSQIRKSTEICNYLSSEPEKQPEKLEVLKEDFNRLVNISSDKNFADDSGLIIEKVYLFHRQGEYMSSFYYAMPNSEIESSNAVFKEKYERFKLDQEMKKAKDYSYYNMFEQKGYLAFTLFDHAMKDCGTLIYEIQTDGLKSILKSVESYNKAFWILYEDSGTILNGYNQGIAENEVSRIYGTYSYKPYTFSLKAGKYRIHNQRLPMNMNLIIGIPENNMAVLLFNSVSIYVAIILVVTIAGLLIFTILTYKITKPIQDVTDKLKMVQHGDFETKLPEYDNLEFHQISQVFNDMTEFVNHLIKQVYEKQLSIKEMELKFLQTQMNPHFMFNVLNTIALKARMDNNEDVFRMISSFTQLIQAKIYRSGTEKVKINQELEYVEYYLYLQKFRYGDRLDYKIEIEDSSLLELYIPKLCIQLIVENAVVHGIEPKMGAGMVRLLMYRKESSVFVDIIDNGIGFDQEGYISLPLKSATDDNASHNHVGLNNANHIIQMMYGEEYGILVYSAKEEGTTVSICIPCDRG